MTGSQCTVRNTAWSEISLINGWDWEVLGSANILPDESECYRYLIMLAALYLLGVSLAGSSGQELGDYSALTVTGAGPPPWPHPYWEIPGDYCRATQPLGQCCQGRQDGCHTPILDTLCYCDTFCNRSVSGDSPQ